MAMTSQDWHSFSTNGGTMTSDRATASRHASTANAHARAEAIRTRVEATAWYVFDSQGGPLTAWRCPLAAVHWMRTCGPDYAVTIDDQGRVLGSRVPPVFYNLRRLRRAEEAARGAVRE